MLSYIWIEIETKSIEELCLQCYLTREYYAGFIYEVMTGKIIDRENMARFSENRHIVSQKYTCD
ncbi:MAG: hypothetical protein GY820_05445 [Gammaproteobacteria bacterium]|nr:hypothetical protein [Gammaproteobacteria bacterium]